MIVCQKVAAQVVEVGRNIVCYHEVRKGSCERDVALILKHGFRISDNKRIMPGVYAFPRPPDGKLNDCSLVIELRPGARFLDSDTDRPTDAYMGNGNAAWNTAWVIAAKRAGWDFTGELDPDRRVEFYSDIPSREKYVKWMAKTLLSCGVDLITQGGEIVILNPERAIAGVRRPTFGEKVSRRFEGLLGLGVRLDDRWARTGR